MTTFFVNAAVTKMLTVYTSDIWYNPQYGSSSMEFWAMSSNPNVGMVLVSHRGLYQALGQ